MTLNSLWTEQFLEQIVQISVIFISNKSLIMKIKDWYHKSLTSNISAKTWSNSTCWGCFENVKTISNLSLVLKIEQDLWEK